MFCSGPGFEWLCWNPVSVLTMVLQKHSVNSWLKTFFFWDLCLTFIYLLIYLFWGAQCLPSAPRRCIFITMVDSDLKIHLLWRIGWSQPFPLSYVCRIVVVAGLAAFFNVSAAWISACAVILSPAKKRMINDALGYSQLPWERCKIWAKHETIADPSWVSLF